ncbi:hypothetical protein ACFWGL_03880 [Streptomyces sp. NPDC060286]|uniref:hypothetical protein n=1 Tax=unclassified Streptomyces TaxID=2593676 RepID=UPI0035D7D651
MHGCSERVGADRFAVRFPGEAFDHLDVVEFGGVVVDEVAILLQVLTDCRASRGVQSRQVGQVRRERIQFSRIQPGAGFGPQPDFDLTASQRGCALSAGSGPVGV